MGCPFEFRSQSLGLLFDQASLLPGDFWVVVDILGCDLLFAVNGCDTDKIEPIAILEALIDRATVRAALDFLDQIDAIFNLNCISGET